MDLEDIDRTVRLTDLKSVEANEGSRPQLVVLRGHERGRVFLLHGGEVSIGRRIDNNVVLFSSAVSKRHASIDCSGAQLVIRDLGSTNGTRVNNARLARDELRELRLGDIIELGDHLLLLCESNGEDSLRGLDEITFDSDKVRAEVDALLRDFPQLTRRD